ncbi:DUF4468 domain-containing protein [Flavobacteriaceae bacterium]|nr:DUF4468 domain-containing protein [Flavobacteriaceae bacterium]
MKIYKIIIALLIPLVSYAQELNYDNGLYTKVFQTEKSNEEVYQKSREWIAINFKSANDVLQLDTKEKLIVKGSMGFKIYQDSYIFDYVGDIVITISIRDGRFKVDFEMTEAENIEYRGKKDFKKFQFMVYGGLSEEDFLARYLKDFETAAIREGFKEKKINKTKQDIIKGNSDRWKKINLSRIEFESRVASNFISLEEYINSSKKEDDW